MTLLLVSGLVAFTTVNRAPTRSAAADGLLAAAWVVEVPWPAALDAGCELEAAVLCAVVRVSLVVAPGGSLVVELFVDFLPVLPPHEARPTAIRASAAAMHTPIPTSLHPRFVLFMPRSFPLTNSLSSQPPFFQR
jgi:hypothetical protein